MLRRKVRTEVTLTHSKAEVDILMQYFCHKSWTQLAKTGLPFSFSPPYPPSSHQRTGMYLRKYLRIPEESLRLLLRARGSYVLHLMQ